MVNRTKIYFEFGSICVDGLIHDWYFEPG